MGFSKEEYWSGLPFSSAEDLSDPGIEPVSPEYLSEDLSCKFFLNIECFISALHLELLSGSVESQ